MAENLLVDGDRGVDALDAELGQGALLVGESGIATPADAALMMQLGVDGVFSASPVAADGKVYFLSENGETIVLCKRNIHFGQ